MTLVPVGRTETQIRVNGSTQGTYTQDEDTTYNVQVTPESTSSGTLSYSSYRTHTDFVGEGSSLNPSVSWSESGSMYDVTIWAELDPQSDFSSGPTYRTINLRANGTTVWSKDFDAHEDTGQRRYEWTIPEMRFPNSLRSSTNASFGLEIGITYARDMSVGTDRSATLTVDGVSRST